MKLITTLLLCLTVNGVAAKWKCEKRTGTPGVCKLYDDGGFGRGEPPQGCRKASPCNKKDDECVPNQWHEPGVGICDHGFQAGPKLGVESLYRIASLDLTSSKDEGRDQPNVAPASSEVSVPSKNLHSDSTSPEPGRVDDIVRSEQRRRVSTSMLECLRDVSFEMKATGGYIAASSGITMSQMVPSILKRREPEQQQSRWKEHLSPRSLTARYNLPVDTAIIPRDMADRKSNHVEDCPLMISYL
ncbi:hypothetical protein Vi05172_g13575 [Venturia inaequalis]|nr:hypothetical protein Vi05172_g13575 [Venturia inaequalis]